MNSGYIFTNLNYNTASKIKTANQLVRRVNELVDEYNDLKEKITKINKNTICGQLDIEYITQKMDNILNKYIDTKNKAIYARNYAIDSYRKDIDNLNQSENMYYTMINNNVDGITLSQELYYDLNAL